MPDSSIARVLTHRLTEIEKTYLKRGSYDEMYGRIEEIRAILREAKNLGEISVKDHEGIQLILLRINKLD
jgi:hypothetical protein